MEILVVLLLVGIIAAIWERRKHKRASDTARLSGRAPAPYRRWDSLGICFDIDRLGNTAVERMYYGHQARRIFMQHFHPRASGQAILWFGDTQATVNGQENRYCIAVTAEEPRLLSEVRRTFSRLEDPGLSPLGLRFTEHPVDIEFSIEPFKAIHREPLPMWCTRQADGTFYLSQPTAEDVELCREFGKAFALPDRLQALVTRIHEGFITPDEVREDLPLGEVAAVFAAADLERAGVAATLLTLARSYRERGNTMYHDYCVMRLVDLRRWPREKIRARQDAGQVGAARRYLDELQKKNQAKTDNQKTVQQALANRPAEVSAQKERGIFKRFTERARQVIIVAREEAARYHHDYLGTEHLLLGILQDGSGSAITVLQMLGVDLNQLKQEVERHLPRSLKTVEVVIPFTLKAKKALEFAVVEARRMGCNDIHTGHLFLGLLNAKDSLAFKVFNTFGVRLVEARGKLLNLLQESVQQSKENRRPPVQKSSTDYRTRQAVEGLYSGEFSPDLFLSSYADVLLEFLTQISLSAAPARGRYRHAPASLGYERIVLVKKYDLPIGDDLEDYLSPNLQCHARFLWMIACTLRQSGRNEEAAAARKKLLEMLQWPAEEVRKRRDAVEIIRTINDLAGEFITVGDNATAERLYVKLHELMAPGSEGAAEALALRACPLANMRQYDEAIRIAAQALAQAPTSQTVQEINRVVQEMKERWPA